MDTRSRPEQPIFAVRQAPRALARPAVHVEAALALITGGKALVEQRSTWTLEPGDLLVVPSGEPHRFLEGRAESWSLGFRPSFVPDRDQAWFLDPFERVRDGASAVVRIPSSRQGFVEGLFAELERTNEPRAATSLLTLILHEIRGAAAPQSAAATRPAGNVVGEALRYIERHCLGPLTLQDVAAAVGRSPAHVTTAVKRATGRTVVEWIIDGRMAEARRMLLHSSEKVDEIAERVGYADPTHFIRMFRRAHGATPARWRSARG